MSTRKKKAVLLEVKKQIIYASANRNNSELEKDFGVPRPTIINIMNNKEEILKAIDEGGSAKRARLKKGKHEEMEEALVIWIKKVLNQNINVTGELIKVSF